MNNQELKKTGLKVTVPRLKILRLFENAKTRHLSAEDIHKQLNEMGDVIGLATIYRILSQFEVAGLITRHHFAGDKSIFEQNEGEHHDHMICTECGKVIEFVDTTIEKHQKTTALRHGFLLTGHAMYLYGRCLECQSFARTTIPKNGA
jgi:Fur family ferric uptake transcriptional regulator